MSDEQIFARVFALPESVRGLFLVKACADAEQGKPLQALLAADEQTDSLLDSDSMNSDSGDPEPIPQRLGDFDILCDY